MDTSDAGFAGIAMKDYLLDFSLDCRKPTPIAMVNTLPSCLDVNVNCLQPSILISAMKLAQSNQPLDMARERTAVGSSFLL